MNISNIIDNSNNNNNNNNNSNTFSTTTIRFIRKYHTESPFNSWYIGGVLFLFTFILGLLFASHYQNNSCQAFWMRFIPILSASPRQGSASTNSFINRIVNPVHV
ncbi:unnamed protein product [Rotaria magnacalcarata]|uniref:Uncharacterized protein n=1 Tax=Rotaria magnacalcarata TaxID=392030 RepID=A0A816MYY5_9BILA|nr:unnamed protein product [Rotaria magnacalcarata]CAF1392141.1 unnamed protein product [Rotaria magnacalcarata]CAF1928064.1 unnamed protein product [Rotaria magnacalcarata]CAF2018746.1 unnamed protein product [Rotaria magnacalcarata]CAF2105063.1 unnamed protein product [Rotaria magnacalcarata]